MKKLKLTAILLVLSVICSNSTASAATIKYDFTGDNVIDIKDIAFISQFYSKNSTTYDLNNDGIIDIFDITLLSRKIDYSIFKIYNENGELIKGYNSGELNTAISEASKLQNGFIINDGKVIWNSTSYWVFDGEKFIKECSTAYSAISSGEALPNGRVFSKQGLLLLNNTTGYREILGVTSENVNFREGASTSTSTQGVLSNGTLVKLNKIARKFFGATLYKSDKSTQDGYIYYDYLDIIQDDNNNSYLGYIAAKNESSMDGGAISDNPSDKGGVSCGAFQLSANMGSLGAFISWLQPQAPEFYTKLITAKNNDGGIYGTSFKNAWIEIANTNHDKFYKLQQQYIKIQYYDGFLKKATTNGYNANELVKYTATRNMIMSTAIQHGVTGAYNIFTAAGNSTDINYLINRVYEERLKVIAKSYPPTSSDPGVVAIYNAVKGRFERECAEIKRLYQRELTY